MPRAFLSTLRGPPECALDHPDSDGKPSRDGKFSIQLRSRNVFRGIQPDVAGRAKVKTIVHYRSMNYLPFVTRFDMIRRGTKLDVSGDTEDTDQHVEQLITTPVKATLCWLQSPSKSPKSNRSDSLMDPCHNAQDPAAYVELAPDPEDQEPADEELADPEPSDEDSDDTDDDDGEDQQMMGSSSYSMEHHQPGEQHNELNYEHDREAFNYEQDSYNLDQQYRSGPMTTDVAEAFQLKHIPHAEAAEAASAAHTLVAMATGKSCKDVNNNNSCEPSNIEVDCEVQQETEETQLNVQQGTSDSYACDIDTAEPSIIASSVGTRYIMVAVGNQQPQLVPLLPPPIQAKANSTDALRVALELEVGTQQQPHLVPLAPAALQGSPNMKDALMRLELEHADLQQEARSEDELSVNSELESFQQTVHLYAEDAHGKAIHKCQICEKVFTIMDAFRAHVSTHFRQRNKCWVCGKQFSRSWLLKGHLRTHTGERPYICGHTGCHKAFADKSNLRSHALIHATEDKLFTCDKCGRAFAQKRYLHKHKLEVCKI